MDRPVTEYATGMPEYTISASNRVENFLACALLPARGSRLVIYKKYFNIHPRYLHVYMAPKLMDHSSWRIANLYVFYLSEYASRYVSLLLIVEDQIHRLLLKSMCRH